MKTLLQKKLSPLKSAVLLVCLIISGTVFNAKHSFALAGPAPTFAAAYCNAGFFVKPNGLQVNYTDMSFSSDAIVKWSWAFGDGSTSNLKNPSHTYSSNGLYNVCLTIQSSSGCTDSVCRGVYVYTAPPPPSNCKAAFTFRTTNFYNDLSMSFTDISISANSIVNWNWSFGDGTTSNVKNPVHLYSSAGNYNVCLATTDNLGCKDTTCLNVYVTVISVNPIPTKYCQAAFLAPPNGLQVNFKDVSVASGTITNWSWTFGDGSTSNLQNPSHTYSSTGTYNVCLAIKSSTGCVDTLCRPVYAFTVPPLPSICKAAFIFKSTNFYNDLSMSFADVSFSFNPIVSWDWNFGDGTTSNVKNPVHVYNSAGNYNVCLATVDSSGCKDTMCLNVYVTTISANPIPTPLSCQAVFIPHANGLKANFNDISYSVNLVTSWSWTFGDGGTSTLQNPTHTYLSKGIYNVCLTIQSAGCQSTICRGVYVDSGLVYLNKGPEYQTPAVSKDAFVNEVKLKVYPNPAAESTAISYLMPIDGFAKVSVYDVLGNEVEVLVSSSVSKGENSIVWKTDNVSSGIYLVRIVANGNVITQRLMVTK